LISKLYASIFVVHPITAVQCQAVTVVYWRSWCQLFMCVY